MAEVPLTGIGVTPLLIAMMAVFFAAIVQSTVGMGFGQVAAPVLLLVDPAFVPSAVIIMGGAVAVNGAARGRHDVAARGRHDVAGREIGLALTGRVLGAIGAGQLLIVAADPETFSLVFAGLLLLAVGLSLTTWQVQLSPRNLLFAGTVSGFMGTITSVGAPPMGIVYQNAPGPHVRATLNAFFAIGTMISLAALAAHGWLGLGDVILALSLAPALAAGTWVSRFLTDFVDRRFRPLVLIICSASALAIVVKTMATG